MNNDLRIAVGIVNDKLGALEKEFLDKREEALDAFDGVKSFEIHRKVLFTKKWAVVLEEMLQEMDKLAESESHHQENAVPVNEIDEEAMDTQATNNAHELLAEVVQDLVDEIPDTPEPIEEVAEDIVEEIAEEVTEELVETIEEVVEEVTEMLEEVAEIAESLEESMGEIAEEIEEVIEEVVEEVVEMLEMVAENVAEEISEISEENAEEIAEVLTEALEEVVEEVAQILEEVVEEVTEIIEEATEEESEIIEEATEEESEITEEATEEESEIIEEAIEEESEIIEEEAVIAEESAEFETNEEVVVMDELSEVTETEAPELSPVIDSIEVDETLLDASPFALPTMDELEAEILAEKEHEDAPEQFFLLGNIYEVVSWSEILMKVCEVMLNKAPFIVPTFGEDETLNPNGQINFSYDPEEIGLDPEDETAQLSNGLWVNLTLGKDEIIDVCINILKVCGYDESNIEI